MTTPVIHSVKSNTDSGIDCIILAAGNGTRMRSDTPKVLHMVAHRPMLQHVIACAETLLPASIIPVIGPQQAAVAEASRPYTPVVQETPRGTADAVRAARARLQNPEGDVLILYGDTPLVTEATLTAMRTCRAETNAAVVVSGFYTDHPTGYGRLICDAMGRLKRIVEEADASPAEQAQRRCNGGLMLFHGPTMWKILDAIDNKNARQEYYLTEAVNVATREGLVAMAVDVPAEDILGVNDRVQLAIVEHVMQRRLRHKAMMDGATLMAPDTVFFAHDTVLGKDVTVAPHVVFGPAVRVADGVTVPPFTYLERTHVTGSVQKAS